MILEAGRASNERDSDSSGAAAWTNALIARYQGVLDDPNTAPKDAAALSVNLRSLRNVQARLEQQFLQLAADQQLEVYRYRLLVGDGGPSLSGIGEAWTKLQSFFAAVYQALRKTVVAGGKKPVQSAFQIPELGYAYSFPGSVGVVVTLPRPVDVALLADSPVEDASNTVFDLLESRNIQGIARSLGPAPIQAFNEWLEVHVRHHYGVDLEWRANNAVKRKAQVPYDEMVGLQGRVLDTKTRQTIITSGLLFGVNTKSQTFSLHSDNGDEIEGKYRDGVIHEEHSASVPARYTATIVTTTDLIPSPDKKSRPEIVLEKLEPL